MRLFNSTDILLLLIVLLGGGLALELLLTDTLEAASRGVVWFTAVAGGRECHQHINGGLVAGADRCVRRANTGRRSHPCRSNLRTRRPGPLARADKGGHVGLSRRTRMVGPEWSGRLQPGTIDRRHRGKGTCQAIGICLL